MKLHSIYTKITLIFITALLLLLTAFGFYLKTRLQQNVALMQERDMRSALYLMRYFRRFKRIDRDYLDTFDYALIDGVKQQKRILFSAKKVFEKKTPIIKLVILRDGLDFYVLIKSNRFAVLLKDLKKPKKKPEALFWFGAVFLFLILVYIWILKSLKPLRELRKDIREFAKGNLKIECKSDKKDEIAEVANEFDNAVKKIDALLKSRQLFLRTIMHELKTPIGKGRIVSEMVEDEKQKERLRDIFERLDLLIVEFSKIERVISKNYDLKPKRYKISDITEQAIDLLMIDNPKDQIKTDIKDNFLVKADFDLLSLAVKNLLDNALKYGEKSSVTLLCEKGVLSVISGGQKLKEPFRNYLKPFNSINKTSKGLGLGIYITHSIAKLHGMEFDYHYEKGWNIFKIKTKNQATFKSKR